MAGTVSIARNHAETRRRMAYLAVIRPSLQDKTLGPTHDAAIMTLFSATQNARGSRGPRRSHLVPIVLASALAAGAIALVAYLLWPTFGPDASNGPERLPVSIGNTLFNVPAAAVRMKIQ